jgi:hypothetical protein
VIRTRSRRALFVAASALGFSTACSPPGLKGELMMIVTTDMSLPKDIDKVRIEVTAGGRTPYKNDFVGLGAPGALLKLPGALGILVNEEDPSTPVTLRVVAWQRDVPRVLQELVSTVPEGRQVAMRMPVQWLCDESAVPTIGSDSGEIDAKSTCGEGETCIAGTCEKNEIDSNDLPPYDPADVFGGGTGDGDGTCFDTAPCFVEITPAVVDGDDCTIKAGENVNVALRVASDGICGPAGCFVPLDANSAVGWMPAGNRVELPKALCGPTGQIEKGKVLGVVTSPVTDTCPLKTESIPTCGPWSSTGSPPPPSDDVPVALITGQNHPVGLGVDRDNVYWTNAGTPLDGTGPAPEPDGAVRSISISGGSPLDLATEQPAARDLAVVRGAETGLATAIYWTNGGTRPPDGPNPDGSLFALRAGEDPEALLTDEAGPQGITVQGNNLFWTGFGVYKLSLTSLLKTTISPDPPTLAEAYYPTRVVSDGAFVYWTNEGTFENEDGAVGLSSVATPNPVLVDLGPANPRGIALDMGPDGQGNDGEALGVFVTNFQPNGQVFYVPISSGTPGAPEEIASELAFPNGIAADADHVYWTNRGGGTVMRMRRNGSGAPDVLVQGQSAPGSIVIDADFIYWINEGSSDKTDGAVMRLVKPK